MDYQHAQIKGSNGKDRALVVSEYSVGVLKRAFAGDSKVSVVIPSDKGEILINMKHVHEIVFSPLSEVSMQRLINNPQEAAKVDIISK